MNEQVLKKLKLLTKEDYLQLVAYAEKRLSIIFKGKKVPEGRTGRDFVQDIFKKILNGTRNWNQEATPNFKNYLFSTVKSEINNFSRSKVCGSESDIENDSDFWMALLEEENFLENKIQEEVVEYVYDRLNEVDSDLGTLLILELEGCDTNEIEKEMGLKTKDVYNLRKRLRRHGPKFWYEISQQEALK